MLCPFLSFVVCFRLFFEILLFLRQLFLILAPAVLGRRDGSIHALRKRRSRNETDNFIESISQMVPRWSPEVPDGPQRSAKPITSSNESACSSKVDLIWHLRPIRKGHNYFILILCLSCFRSTLDFDLVFTI